MNNKKLFKVAVTLLAATLLLLLTTIALAKPPLQSPDEDGESSPHAEPVDEPEEELLGIFENVNTAESVSKRIPVQGYLTDINGNAITGTTTITYALYETASGGTPLCTDSDPLAFNDGLFNGYLDTCTSGDVNGKQLYLGFSVEGDAEMTPRQTIYPVPYAFSLAPGADISSTLSTASMVYVVNSGVGNNTSGVRALAGGASGITYGVIGENESTEGRGVYGWTKSGSGTTYGVYGKSDSSSGRGVYGRVNGTTAQGVRGYNAGNGPGIVARSLTGNPFEAFGGVSTNTVFSISNSGNVYADGGYHCGNTYTDTSSKANLAPCLQDNSPADFAEMLPVSDQPEAGDVLVIGSDGVLNRSSEAYQPTVAGVYSTRPSYLGNSRFLGQADYAPLAMVGIVPVKVSTENGNIQPGDLLVTSNTTGHAMKADSNPPTGTVIGKAMAPMDEETGTIQMLVMLQ